MSEPCPASVTVLEGQRKRQLRELFATWRNKFSKSRTGTSASVTLLSTRTPSFALREHGHIRKRQTRTGVKFTVFYDGPYDVWQHENLHAEHPRGGGPKFLENALKLYMPLIERAVAGEVRQSMPKTRRARGR
jgi:hypothetical protein